MILAQDTISTGTIIFACVVLGAILGAVQFLMKLIEWKVNARGKTDDGQSKVCAIQHSALKATTDRIESSMEKLTDATTSLMSAMERFMDALSTEARIADMRHKEIMRGFEVMQSELRDMNHRLESNNG
jgi:hypothetical protein